MLQTLRRSYHWMRVSTNSPYADYALCFLFYLEAIFFFPTDPILIMYCLERQDKALYYATIATIGSVLGGLTSYMIGALLWHWCGEQIIHNYYISFLIKPSQFEYVRSIFQTNALTSIFMGGFFFVPFKVTTLSAGFCKLNLLSFIIAAFIVRGIRFYLFAILCKLFGNQIKDFMSKKLKFILAGIFIILAICYWIFTYYS